MTAMHDLHAWLRAHLEATRASFLAVVQVRIAQEVEGGLSFRRPEDDPYMIEAESNLALIDRHRPDDTDRCLECGAPFPCPAITPLYEQMRGAPGWRPEWNVTGEVISLDARRRKASPPD